jgi:hypothetical protein
LTWRRAREIIWVASADRRALPREPMRSQGMSEALPPNYQACPQCDYPMVAIAGSKQAICRNCGYKEPCC